MLDSKPFNDMYLVPDGWRIGELVKEDNDTYKDDSWPGCDYRIKAHDSNLGINLSISGRKSHYFRDYSNKITYKTRVKIEHVGDGEESTFNHGWIFSQYPLAGA